MALPARLQEIVEEFADLPAELRLEALLDYSRRVPPLPERLAGHRDAMEQVPECQTPFFLATELDDGDRVISPLRLRGISAILGRLKRQVGVQVEARSAGQAPA